MNSSHVTGTDEFIAPATDDDVNNPFYEPPSTSSTPTSGASDVPGRFHPSTYLRKLKMTESASGSWWRSASWTNVVHVVLVSGRQMSLSDGTSQVYVKFKFANERYKTRVKPKSTTQEWLEQFELHVTATPPTSNDVTVTSSNPALLDISLRSRNYAARDQVIGSTRMDVISLDKDDTHDMELSLDNNSGLLRLLVTVSDTRPTPKSSRPHHGRPSHHSDALLKYTGFCASFRNLSDVGWLEVKVLQAKYLAAADVRGTSDPYCVLQLINSRRQTHTDYKTLNPQWNSTFTFDVTDIHAVLEVFVYDENPDKKVDFLGKIAIPLLRVVGGEKRWYQLKDLSLSCRTKGCIQLEMDFVFNNFKAAFRTFNPRQTQYTQLLDKFQVSVMRQNVARLKKIANSAQQVLNVVVDCLEWRSKPRSAAALMAFTGIVLFIQLFMVPLLLLAVLVITHFVQQMKQKLHIIGDTDDPEQMAAEAEDRDVEMDDRKSKVENKGVVEKLQTIQDTCLQVQESMDVIASLFERIENVLTWKVPWLSFLAVVALTFTTVIFLVVPLRYIVLIWGLVKFTAKLRHPDAVHHVGLFDFLARVPSNRQLMQYRELTDSFAGRKKKQ